MCSFLNTVPQLKPKLNNAETKKPFHEFSFIVKKAGETVVTTITSLIVSITKFLIMIGSPRAYYIHTYIHTFIEAPQWGLFSHNIK